MDMETWNARLSIVIEWLENSTNESEDFEDTLTLVHFRRQSGVTATYANAEAYAIHKTKTLYNQLLRLWKNEQWDGSMDGLHTINFDNGE